MSYNQTGSGYEPQPAQLAQYNGENGVYVAGSDFPCFSGFATAAPDAAAAAAGPQAEDCTRAVQPKKLNLSARNRRRIAARQNTIRRLTRQRHIGLCIQRANANKAEQLYNLATKIESLLSTDLMQHFLTAVSQYQTLAPMSLARSPVEQMDVDEIGSFTYTQAPGNSDYTTVSANQPMPFYGCMPFALQSPQNTL